MWTFNKNFPWKNRVSIYEYINDKIKKEGSLKTMDLPDEKLDNDTEVRFAPGALDGIFTHHSTSDVNCEDVVKLIDKIASQNKDKDKIEFYNLILEKNIVSIIDNIIEELGKAQIEITNNLIKWISFLAFESPDRNAVKTGIALLGAAGIKKCKDKLKILGVHEEFTLYVSVALINISEDYELELFDLAKSVHGWGRIEIVERLANTTNKEIKKWILLEGYKNNILYEYSTTIAANTGELKNELSKEVVEDDILVAASDIIQGLICEGPCIGISDYEDAKEVLSLYVKHTINKDCEIMHLLTHSSIYNYLSNMKDENLEKNGWTKENKDYLLKILKLEMEDPKWINYILDKLNNTDEKEFYKYEQGANILNLDIFDLLLDRLEKNPLNQSNWYSVINKVKDEDIDIVLDLASKTIPLSKISTGPDVLMGFGLKFNLNSILDCILQKLRNFEGMGEAFVITGLKSPVIRNRNMAINVVENWKIKSISTELKTTLKEAYINEPEEEVKDRIKMLIDKF